MPSEEFSEDKNAHCVGPTSADAGTASACAGCPNQSLCSSGAFSQRDPELDIIQEKLREVRHKLLILSGKGGVGKSTFTKELGLSLGRRGLTVGLVDIDICGPSLPRMTGCLEDSVHQSSEGWEPVAISDNVVVMSIQLLLEKKDDAIVWRGPKKNRIIKDFLMNVNWGPLDVLLFDTPPGTTDEHISTVNILNDSTGVDGAVVVTTPHELSIADVRRELTFCNKANLRVLGLVENMSCFVCPNCSKSSDIFPKARSEIDGNESPATEPLAGAEILASEFHVPLLGRIPFDHFMMRSCEAGMSVAEFQAGAISTQPIEDVTDKVLQSITFAPREDASGV
ncbi:nucleotide-binding protein [Perkinsela sp. CCAP 1560/4]|nr:nucleotide-binding protein [Perkinsela sp. CCAP 1560/4]KNH06709.1 nucleotide-binding protein [Perkinsela sp. CCAP 1560/4]|eukprot:KNH04704.1 nucleotide-binding protein [Perkinsela sp. CCAP 1560/4]